MRRKGALLAVAAVAVVLAGAGVAVMTTGGGGSAEGSTAPPVPPTAEVTRGDLVDSEAVDGRLTYAGERDLTASLQGTVTAVPAEGAIIKRGRALLKVDREPLVLMYGTLPLYRALDQNVSDGPDVEQLERNLKALGYGDDMTVDEDFTYATHLAVTEWQDDRGLPETGVVDGSQVIFLDGAVRVASRGVEVGDQAAPGHKLLTVSGTRRVVEVALDSGDQAMARKGAKVTVELPGGKETTGKISKVGTVAKEISADQGGGSTIDVEITLTGGGAGRLDQAPVTVNLESERVKDVLTVPVEALLALREGGFGIEVVEGGVTRLLAIETGAYGAGRVEISGTGLAEGMKVGVPAS